MGTCWELLVQYAKVAAVCLHIDTRAAFGPPPIPALAAANWCEDEAGRGEEAELMVVALKLHDV
eukprot:1835575-Lingulodinium_polyedra.AAC.1